MSVRLPSESEWECACRGGSDDKWSFGDEESKLEEYAWYEKNSEMRTHPVGELRANAFRLHDMHGNVMEWCEDVWHANYDGAPDDGSAWTEGGAPLRVSRGGGWIHPAGFCRSACR